MGENRFELGKKKGYFKKQGVNVMAFDDIYPVGHQSGVSIIMHGNRMATNGDLRFEPTPGQWQPVPKQLERVLDEETNTITTTLTYPDYEGHMTGFNPMMYPDIEMTYQVVVKGVEDGVEVSVDLNEPVPDAFAGKLCFNLELFPGSLFEKPWIMDDKQGIFPRQPNGPTLKRDSNYPVSGHLPAKEGAIVADREKMIGDGVTYNPILADDCIAEPYASGHTFTIRPEDPYSCITIESKTAPIELYDGRMNHNNGWFVLSSVVPKNTTTGAIVWKITPHVVEDWKYQPVVQVSQVGYHPNQPKVAMVELDQTEQDFVDGILYEITAMGRQQVKTLAPKCWGDFLRYRYVQLDFSDVTKEGLYQIAYQDTVTNTFRIAKDIYDRGVWQPVLEYFLPVQMCHMRVNEKYKVWHGLCHNDDARMAPVNCAHFDGYMQGPTTMTKYKPLQEVPGLNAGGWHDAGDFDLRIESQAGECYKLALAYEEFHVEYDVTTIDQERKVTEIHQPDGKNDILQQIEHGLLSVVGGYKSLGRLYRGIICEDLRQYVLLGDPANMTPGGVDPGEKSRLVFTEDNPSRELTTAAQLAASARAMRDYDKKLAEETLRVAEELYEITKDKEGVASQKAHAAVELYLTTEKDCYKEAILASLPVFLSNMMHIGWLLARVVSVFSEEQKKQIMDAVKDSAKEIEKMAEETPYQIPYHPHIWGAGWDIQGMAFRYYFMYKAFPDIFSRDVLFNALHFVLGCHPGSNTSSFASGVGAKSTTTAYGINRADWFYVPGGVTSGTALIRPDFPELLEFPFLWQQMEYVMGGGSSDYMFLVLAVQDILKNE